MTVLAAEVDNLLPFFVNGVFRGGGYALAGLGLVLIFRTARVVNFAHGAIATFCTFAFVAMRGAVPTPVALLGAMALGALFGVVVELTTMRPLQERPDAAKLVATIGWLLVVQFATGLVFGGQPETIAPIAPTTAVGIFGVRIAYYQILLLVTAVVVAVLLWYWLNRTSFGTALRAVSYDRGSAQLLSINANRITTVAWAVGGALAALAGILIAPASSSNHRPSPCSCSGPSPWRSSPASTRSAWCWSPPSCSAASKTPPPCSTVPAHRTWSCSPSSSACSCCARRSRWRTPSAPSNAP